MAFWVTRILNVALLVYFAVAIFSLFLTTKTIWIVLVVSVLAVTVMWYLFAPQISVGTMQAKPLDEISELSSFLQKAREYASKAGLPKAPRLYVIDSPAVNALSIGHPHNAAVVFTSGAFEHLDKNQLIAVLGHEYQHIRQHDSLLLIFNMVVAAAIRLATYFLALIAGLIGIAIDVLAAMYGVVRGGESTGGFLVRLVRKVSEWGLQLVNLLLMAASRQAEFRADAGGARLAGLANGSAMSGVRVMQSTLKVLHEVNGVEPTTDLVSRLNASHPPLNARLAKLEALARSLEPAA